MSLTQVETPILINYKLNLLKRSITGYTDTQYLGSCLPPTIYVPNWSNQQKSQICIFL